MSADGRGGWIIDTSFGCSSSRMSTTPAKLSSSRPISACASPFRMAMPRSGNGRTVWTPEPPKPPLKGGETSKRLTNLGRVGSDAPGRRHALEGGQQPTVGGLHLDGPRVVGPWPEALHARMSRVGDVQHAPTAVPQVADVQVPAVAYHLQGQLEAGPAVEVAVADQLDVVRLGARATEQL